MQMWKKGCLGLALMAGLTPSVSAQVPLTPPSAGGATPLAAPPATQPTTLWDFLGVSKTQRQACKEYICKTQIGQLFNNGLRPLGVISGGLLGPCCPPFNTEDLLKPPDSAEGAAARIKQDEAAAKARRAAVRYLGTVDCHFWPEAQDALIGSLRTDRNECVRWEAAMALGSGCCCNRATIKALAITVSGSEEDGNPAETSERVKAAAARSLAHCLASCAAVVQPLPIEPAPADKIVPEPVPEPKPEPKPGEKGEVVPGLSAAPNMDYYQKVRKMDMRQIIADAQRAQSRAKVAPPTPPPPAAAARDRSLFGLLRAAMTDPAEKDRPAAPPAPRPAEPRTSAEPPAAPREPAPAPQGKVTPVSLAPAPPPAQPVAPTVMHTPPVPSAPPSVMQAPPAVWQGPPPYAALPPVPPPVVAVPPAVAPAPANVSPAQLVTLLQTSAYPDQREWAVNNLARCDGQSNPQAVEAVLHAARHDPAPLVRAACIRCLVSMNVNTWPVLNTVQALKADADPRVKQEADLALVKLVPGLSGPGAPR